MIAKVSRRLAQQIVETVKDVCGKDVNFISPSGVIFASTSPQRVGEFHEIGQKAAQTGTVIEVNEDGSFEGTQKGVNIPLFHQNSLLAVIGISGPPEDVRKFGYLAVRVTLLLIREQELDAAVRSRREKIRYMIRSLVLKGEGDAKYLKGCMEEFKISCNGLFLVCDIRLNEGYNPANISIFERDLDVFFHTIGIELYCHESPREYVALIPQQQSILYRRHFCQFAAAQEHTFSAGLGTARTPAQLSHSYREALTAIHSLHFSDQCFCDFSDLDVEILFDGLDPDRKKDYLEKTVSRLSQEDMRLLQVYYEENMSLTETGKRLFLHKNTLQYRLKRIARITGYDPRVFRDGAALYLGVRMRTEQDGS